MTAKTGPGELDRTHDKHTRDTGRPYVEVLRASGLSAALAKQAIRRTADLKPKNEAQHQ
jgi:hypothetical protein